MEKKNVYDRARKVVRELVPLLHTIREHDKSLADQLKRAAQSVVLENNAVHRPMNLIEEGSIALPYNRKNLPQPTCCLQRPLLNNESHE